MSITAEEIIATCEVYEPYRPLTPEEQKSLDDVLEQLDTLRCIHLGTPKSMAIGIAIKVLSTINPEDYGLHS